MMMLTQTGSRIKNKEESPSLPSRAASAAMMRPPTTRRRRTASHRWCTRLGRFFGEPGGCTVLDETWNIGMFLFLLVKAYEYMMYSRGVTVDPTAILKNAPGTTPGMRPWRAMVLLDNDRQVHPLVHNTVDVVGPRCVKWSYLGVIAIALQVADFRCAWLVRWLGSAILPLPIRKHVE